MNYCPLISSQKTILSKVTCMEEFCALWDCSENGRLVRIALLKYIKDTAFSKEVSHEDELKAQIEILKQQLRAVAIGFLIMNFNAEYKTVLDNAKCPSDSPIGGNTANIIKKDWSGL